MGLMKKMLFPPNTKCPKWGCNGHGVPFDTQKKISVKKAVIGGAVGSMINPIGGVVGAMSGLGAKTGKTKLICNTCGHVWEKQL